ncbi:MAG: Trp family transcriptional regulator [bacterium]|nr:Trp family transcriptional regulator [bacterium]
MSTTCKKYFDKKFKEDIWTRFLREIKNIKNYEEFDAFSDKYFTPQEKIVFEKRLGIFYFLEKGLSYREISRELAITLKTISFVKSGFKKPRKRIIKKNFKSRELLDIEARKGKKYKPLLPSYKGAQSII